MDKEMLKFIEIRNCYVRPRIGELSINEKALAEYEKFCLDLIKQLKKKDEVIKELTKNENSNNFLKDSLKLQIEFNKLLKKNNVTMINLRNLCIPFRDKYNFTDHQTLRIAREEVTKEELLQILEDKEVK